MAAMKHFNSILLLCLIIVIYLLQRHYFPLRRASVFNENHSQPPQKTAITTIDHNGVESVKWQDTDSVKRTHDLELVQNLLMTPSYHDHRHRFPGGYYQPILDPERKLVFCWIPKNACSHIKALFCQQLVTFGSGHRSAQLFKEPFQSHFFCPGPLNLLLKKTNEAQRKAIFEQEEYKKFAIIREPFDRFVSGWISKCGAGGEDLRHKQSCYNCGFDVACFAIENLQFMQEFSRLNIQTHTFNPAWIPSHWFPQYWFCDFQTYQDRYKIFYFQGSKNSSFRNEIRNNLLKAGIDRNLIETNWGPDGNLPFMETGTRHSSDSEQRNKVMTQLTNNMTALDAIYKTYLIDFKAFNISIPQWINDLCLDVDNWSDYVVCRHTAIGS